MKPHQRRVAVHDFGDVRDEYRLDTPRVFQYIRQTNEKLVIGERFQFSFLVHVFFSVSSSTSSNVSTPPINVVVNWLSELEFTSLPNPARP